MKQLRSVILAGWISFVLLPGMVSAVEQEDQVAAHFTRSFDAEVKGEYEGALNEMLQVLRSDVGNYTAMLRTGWLFYQLGRYQDAVINYRKAVALAPGAIEPMLGLTMPLMALYRWKETEVVCLDILKIDPMNYLADVRLAHTLFSLGRFREAAERYSRILVRYPSDIDVKSGLAWAYTRMGRVTDARTLFRQVLRVRANNTSALTGLETLYTQTNGSNAPYVAAPNVSAR